MANVGHRITDLLERLKKTSTNPRNKCSSDFLQYGRLMCEADEAGWPSHTKENLSKCRSFLAVEKPHDRWARNALTLPLDIIRFVAGVTMIFGGTALLLLLTPLQLLNPILRKVGIDPKFSPLMIGEILYNQAVLATLGCQVHIQGEPPEKIWSKQACGILTYNHSYATPCTLTNRMHGVTKKFPSQKNITFATRIRSYLLVFLTAFSRVLAHCSSFIDPFVHQVACVLKGQCLHAHRDLRQVPSKSSTIVPLAGNCWPDAEVFWQEGAVSDSILWLVFMGCRAYFPRPKVRTVRRVCLLK